MVYNEDATINFRDQHDSVHHLVVDYKTELSQVKSHYPIEAEIEIYSPTYAERFRIYLIKDEEIFNKYLRIAEVYRPFHLINPVDSVVVNNELFNQVYIFEEDSSNIQSDVIKVYFNQQFGILKYVKKGEVVYEFEPPNEQQAITNEATPTDRS